MYAYRPSTKNQGDVIRSYAAAHGMNIVQTYADAGFRMRMKPPATRISADVRMFRFSIAQSNLKMMAAPSLQL